MADFFEHRIRQRTFIAVPPKKVYETITSASGWNAFFTTGMTLEPRIGGKCIFRWQNWGPDKYTVEADGEVVEATPESRFAFQWYPAGREHPTTVSFGLEALPDGTVVTCEESGYPDSEKGRTAMLECASDWGEALTLLKFYLEHNIVYTQPSG